MLKRLQTRDPILMGLVLIATLFGLFVIFDAGYARSITTGKGIIPREFLSQIIWVMVSVALGGLVACLKPAVLKKVAKWSALATCILCIAVLVPGVGTASGGAHRWLKYVQIQPAEFAKLGVILYLAYVFSTWKQWPAKMPRMRRFSVKLDNYYLPMLARGKPIYIVALIAGLVAIEPDLGTAAVIAFTAYMLFAFGGFTRRAMTYLTVAALIGGVLMIKMERYRIDRIMHHSERWEPEYIDDEGYQTVQSELHMATGHLTGVGLGAGRAKHMLPATTTDFIWATIGEETGFIGSTIVLLLLLAICWRMLVLAANSDSKFSVLVLTGTSLWIAVQTVTNVMMANGFIPPIGIPLPFISYGGSSLISLWIATGVCLSLATKKQLIKEETVVVSGDGWRDRRTRFSGAGSSSLR